MVLQYTRLWAALDEYLMVPVWTLNSDVDFWDKSAVNVVVDNMLPACWRYVWMRRS